MLHVITACINGTIAMYPIKAAAQQWEILGNVREDYRAFGYHHVHEEF